MNFHPVFKGNKETPMKWKLTKEWVQYGQYKHAILVSREK